MSTEILLTGDELVLDGPNYAIKSKNGEEVFLGKLLKRERGFSYFHEAFSIHNDVFVFEYTTNIVLEERLLYDCYKNHIFYEKPSASWYLFK